MLPVLLDLKFIKIYTFGVFLVLAFFWSSFVLWRLIRLSSYKEEDVFDGLFHSLFWSLLSGRLVYVILHFKEFGLSVFKFILINGYPGLSLYGMTFGGIGAFYIWCYFRKIKFEEMVDYFIPSLSLGLAIGKLGSFFSGSEVGVKTKFLLGIKYANMDGLRHLTPLYESIVFVIIFYLTYRILFEIRKEKLSHGVNFSLFAFLLGLVYFVFDNLKQYHLYLLSYSFNKVVSVILLLTFGFYFVYYFRSLIFSRIVRIKNLFLHYVKKHFKKFFGKTKKEDRGRTGKDSATNRSS